jgi:hypothetical protein
MILNLNSINFYYLTPNILVSASPSPNKNHPTEIAAMCRIITVQYSCGCSTSRTLPENGDCPFLSNYFCILECKHFHSCLVKRKGKCPLCQCNSSKSLLLWMKMLKYCRGALRIPAGLPDGSNRDE